MTDRILAAFIGATFAIVLNQTILKFSENRDSERHWRQVAACEAEGGQVVVDGDNWFQGCVLP
jgi:hypothetical protein